jgi:hypothetical protein
VEEEKDWLGRLQRCVAAVRDWEQRISGFEDVEPRSSLDKDDAGLRGNPVRSAAWYGLVTAVDHLGLGADMTDRGLTLRPSALFTVTRAALLGASQAVWVLSGGRNERVSRALSIASDEVTLHRTFVRDYADDSFIRQRQPVEFVEELDRLVERLTQEWSLLDDLRKGRPYAGRFNSTLMMQDAAAFLAKAESNADWLRLALAHEWRMASAAAHARSWPLHVRSTQTGQLPDGSEVRRLTTSVSDLVQSYAAAVLMTNEAWRLWDLRRRKHV